MRQYCNQIKQIAFIIHHYFQENFCFFLYIIGYIALIISAYNLKECDRSFENCKKLVAEIHTNLEQIRIDTLKSEINTGGYHD